jgi:ParB/RepB/Spo0J family partition protein
MNTNVVFVSIEKIVPNRYQQNVRDEAKIAEIAESLKRYRDNGSKGLLQLPTARAENGAYELAFGHHRWYAFEQLAQEDSFWREMPVLIQEMSDEALFEAMGVENLQRRDISIIEKGRIFHDHMTKFHHTSVETGAAFSVTEEYVRSALFLLQLPAAAQQKLEADEITITTGRQLVTVKKLLGDAGVEEALSEMEDGVMHETPQEAIEYVLEQSKATVRLEKNAGWFSAAKFPAKHLEEASGNLIRKVLGITKDTPYPVRSDLLNLLSRPRPVTEEHFPHLYQYLQENDGQGLDKLNVLFTPPACEKCPFHAVLDGDHFCGLVVCHDRKVKGWEKKELEDKAEKVGIPLYTKDDGEAMELSTRSEADKKLVKSRHADLRLMKAQWMWNNFDGLPSTLKVVAVGKLAAKRAASQEKGIEAGNTDRLKRELQGQVYNLKDQTLDRFQWEVAAPAFASALDGITNMAFFRFFMIELSDGYSAALPEGVDDQYELVEQAMKMKKADGLKAMRRIFMVNAVQLAVQRIKARHNLMEARKPVMEFAKALQKIANDWDVKLPKTWIATAEKYQADLDTALKALSAAQKKTEKEA